MVIVRGGGEGTNGDFIDAFFEGRGEIRTPSFTFRHPHTPPHPGQPKEPLFPPSHSSKSVSALAGNLRSNRISCLSPFFGTQGIQGTHSPFLRPSTVRSRGVSGKDGVPSPLAQPAAFSSSLRKPLTWIRAFGKQKGTPPPGAGVAGSQPAAFWFSSRTPPGRGWPSPAATGRGELAGPPRGRYHRP